MSTNRKDHSAARLGPMKVMQRQCATCPFRSEIKGVFNPTLEEVKVRVLTRASQICHHPVLHGKKETHLCRGARNFQLQIFYRMGFLDEPTDEAWERKLKTL